MQLRHQLAAIDVDHLAGDVSRQRIRRQEQIGANAIGSLPDALQRHSGRDLFFLARQGITILERGGDTLLQEIRSQL